MVFELEDIRFQKSRASCRDIIVLYWQSSYLVCPHVGL